MTPKKLLIVILLPLMLVSGCWSRREINALSISQAIAIDREPDGKIMLTFLFAKPEKSQKSGGASSSEKPYALVAEKGETLNEAERNISLGLPRKLFMGQNSLIIYSEQAARSGLGPLVDLFSRHKDFRLTNYVFVTKGRASDIFKFGPNIEDNPVRQMLGAITYAHMRVSKTIPQNLKDFLIKLEEPGIEPVLPEVETVPKLVGEELDQNKTTAEGGGNSRKLKPHLAGMGVFKGDRLVGWLSPAETRSLHFATAKEHIGVEIVPEGL